jgi:hypothetical protein
MNNSDTVSAELGLGLVVHEDTLVPLMASMYYAADDPYAIQIAFHVGLDEPVEWTFARELLSRGTTEAAGLGDVKIWPAADSGSGEVVLNIELSSAYGEARFEAPAIEVADFLRRTYEVVPSGTETRHLDMEEGLAELLRQAL